MTQSENDAQPAVKWLQSADGSDNWIPFFKPPDGLAFAHGWPDGSVDVLMVRCSANAIAERTDPDGQPVWHSHGPVADIMDALGKVPPPDTPDTPHRVLPHDAEPDPRQAP